MRVCPTSFWQSSLILLACSSLSPAEQLQVPGQYSSIQSAIHAAVDGDSVLVAAGSYQGFDFLGKSLFIAGQGGSPAVSIVPAAADARLVRMAGCSDATLSGFTLSGGSADVPGQAVGGALLVDGGQVRLEDLVIRDNTAILGGGLALLDAQADVLDCRFVANQAQVGGGSLVQGGTAHFQHCAWIGNQAEGAAYGGGIALETAASELEQCWWIGNAARLGGALSVRGETEVESIRITGASLSGNQATLGAGLYLLKCTPELERLVVAGSLGNGMLCNQAQPIVRCSLFHGNADGGAWCGIDGGGNQSADPLFCDPQEDLRLQPGSPCWSSACGVMGAFDEDCDGLWVSDPPAAGGHDSTTPPRAELRGNQLVIRLQRPGTVTLQLYDIRGALLESRRLGPLAVGSQTLALESTGLEPARLPSGFYLLSLQASGLNELIPFPHLN